MDESAGNGDEAISLDQIVLLTSTTPNQNSEPLPTGITRWDMDLGGDDTILLRFDEGSGKADMTLLVPVSAFNGALQTDYVYLYSQFGLLGVADPDPGPAANYGASDGFEEWSIKPGVVTTPDGGVTALMLGLSMLGLGLGARRRNKK